MVHPEGGRKPNLNFSGGGLMYFERVKKYPLSVNYLRSLESLTKASGLQSGSKILTTAFNPPLIHKSCSCKSIALHLLFANYLRDEKSYKKYSQTSEMKSMGLRPATLREVLTFLADYSEHLVSYTELYVLGSIYDLASVEEDRIGSEFVVPMFQYSRWHRKLLEVHFKEFPSDWDSSREVFAAVPISGIYESLSERWRTLHHPYRKDIRDLRLQHKRAFELDDFDLMDKLALQVAWHENHPTRVEIMRRIRYEQTVKAQKLVEEEKRLELDDMRKVAEETDFVIKEVEKVDL